MDCDDGPDGFHQSEGPCTLEESVDGAEHAGRGKGEDEPAAPALQRVAYDHGGDGEESEGCEGGHAAQFNDFPTQAKGELEWTIRPKA